METFRPVWYKTAFKMPKTATTGDTLTLECMRGAFSVSNVTKAAPFQWLPYELAPRCISGPWQNLVWFIHFLLMFVHVIHLSLGCWIAYHDDTMQEWRKLYSQFNTIHFSFCLWLYTVNYLKRERLPDFMGRYIKFFQSTTAKPLLSDTRNGFLTKNAISFVKGVRYAMYIDGFLLGLVYLVAPDIPGLWAAWFLKHDETLTVLQVLPWTPIQVYFCLSYTNCGVVFSCCNFCFIFPTANMLKTMQMRLASNNGGWSNLLAQIRLGGRGDQKLLKIYRQLYLLVEEFNSVFDLNLIALKFVFITSAVFCTYGALKLSGVVAGFLAFSGVTLMTLFAAMMVTMGEVNNASKLFLRLVKSRYGYRPRYGEYSMRNFYLEKYLKSTQELKLRVGSTYFIDKGIALTTFRITLDNTINFLLASK